jgi:hypothetical protein
MNTFIKLVEMAKKSENTSIDLAILIAALSLALIPVITKIIKITALNDFDRLFVSKHERSIQQLVVKLKDYLIFTLIYLFVGFYFSLIIKYKPINYFTNSVFSVIILTVFLLTLMILVKKVIITEWLGKKRFHYKEKFTKVLFLINLYTGIYVFSLLFAILISNLALLKSVFSSILLLPIVLLVLYRNYQKRYDYEYICQTINEEQFNNGMLIFKYSLNNDKMIFVQPGDIALKEVYLFEKNANRFFKFTRVEVL